MSSKKRGADSTAWLTMLREELMLIGSDDLIMPDGEVDEEHETDVGEASHEVKKLWTYYCATEERATRMMIDAQYERKNPERKEALRKEALQLKVKAETAKQIMWVCLREQFDLWNPNLGVGIRGDWRVVSFQSADNFIKDILKGLM